MSPVKLWFSRKFRDVHSLPSCKQQQGQQQQQQRQQQQCFASNNHMLEGECFGTMLDDLLTDCDRH
jgi:hypothetical protein